MLSLGYQTLHAGKVRLDPRTKLLILVTMSLVIITGGTGVVMLWLKFLLLFVPPLLCIAERRYKGAFIYLGVIVAFMLLANNILPFVSGALNLLLSMLYVVVSRFMPCVMMGWYFVKTTNVSEFVSAMEKMHVPQCIIIPISVVFRFVPTVAEEFSSINDAMIMRNIRFGRGSISAMFEYRVIPMIMCSLKIGEDLSASALTRGLGSPTPRTSIAVIGFTPIDIVLMIIFFGVVLIYVLNIIGVM